MRDLRGKVVILTGASRGIGVSLAEALARRGARLVLVARTEAGLRETAEKVVASGGQAHVVAADVADVADLARVVAAAEALGPIEGVVHNAGVEHTKAFVDQRPEEIAAQVAINLAGPLHLSRLVLPGLLARRGGFLVFMSSMSGKSPTPYNAVYAATKYGLVGFAQSLRIEVEEADVHVGVVCPGFVDEAGMFASFGLPAPKLLPAVPLRQVVDQTLAAVDGSMEELVTAGPVRPLLALSQIFPRVTGPVLRAMGVLDVLRRRAEAEAGR